MNIGRQQKPRTITIINHPLFGQDHEEAVHFKDTHPRRDHHRHLPSSVKVSVDVVLVKHLKENKIPPNDDVTAFQKPA